MDIPAKVHDLCEVTSLILALAAKASAEVVAVAVVAAEYCTAVLF